MAETLLSFGVEKLWDLLVRESARFQGVEEQFNELKRDLNTLRCFLKDADSMKYTNETVKNNVKEINDIVLDAEDVVETFILKDLGRTSGIGNSVGIFLGGFRERRKLAFHMEVISKRISKVIPDRQTLGVQQLIANEVTRPLQEIQREKRKMFVTSNNEEHLVGLEKNVEILVGYLVEEDSRSQVVSITGMGGLGKTTLARQVFNHKTIKSHFPALAWVCVSQEFTRKHVWKEILRQLRPDLVLGETEEEELHEKLVRVLETQKALIVIDDIWSEGDWDRINPVFLPKKGWKVLLTSRNEEVASHADPPRVTFKPGFLTFEESWDLFQRVAFPTKDTTENKVQEEMEEMGKEMIIHCGGLPLAVKLLCGLLATRHTLSEWERVHKNITSHVVGRTSFNKENIKNVYHILSLSYEELPSYLKHCFLYLAHFREDEEINVEKLAYYWAGDGILRPRCSDGASIRDVGDGYIEELVKRNMVISEKDVRTSRFETCQLHDMVRKFCLVKAEEENFLQIDQGIKAEEENFLQIDQGPSTANSESPYKSRRLVVHKPSHIDSNMEAENPKLRSLLLFGYYDWSASSLRFTRLQLMRVLGLSLPVFKRGKLPSSIGKLIHLRYLSLKGGNLRRIPSSMRNLKQLLYLNLDVLGEVYMPNILKEMRKLTYLHLPFILHDKVNMDLENLVNLETLENFSTKHGCVRDLQGMKRLRTLYIFMKDNHKMYGAPAEEDPGQSTWLSSYLGQLRYLENLTIIDRIERRREFVLECVHLRHLNLDIYMPRLPDEQHLPSDLIYLHLRQCRLEEDPMPILEKLGQLEEVWFSWNSFCGRRMVCSRGGFPQLHSLTLNGLKELEEWIIEEGSMPLLDNLRIYECGKLKEWIVEEGSMPLLQTLTIDNCKALKELRDGLRFITSLKVLSFTMGEEWKEKLSEQHLPSRLTSLKLSECCLEEDPMPILEKLGQLEEVCFGLDCFCGRRIVCSRGGFPQLQKLQLYGLEEWQEWIVEEGSMPLLRVLTIRSCRKLKELPDGLRFITSLTHLEVAHMGYEWNKRLTEGGEDYYKVQHIPNVSFHFS